MSLSFAPFNGVRFHPSKTSLSEALCPPYDVISDPLARRLRRRRGSAIHLELPLGGARRHVRARAQWLRWRAEGVLVQDEALSYYVVEQNFSFRGGRHARIGIFGALGLDSGTYRRVLRHEKTMAKPKKDRTGLLRTVKVNTSPIFGIYPDQGGGMRAVLKSIRRCKPVAAGKDPHGIRYRVWRTGDCRINDSIEKVLSSKKVLIADGHHRYEVARDYWRTTREPGAERILAYLVAEEDAGLLVRPTHRVVACAPSILRAAERRCRQRRLPGLKSLEAALANAASPVAFGLVHRDFRLMLPANGGVASRFGTDWLARRLLTGIDPQRIAYFHESGAAVKAARRAGGLALLVRPFSVVDIRRAVERAGLLPQKSTYFYPKIATGVVFRSFK